MKRGFNILLEENERIDDLEYKGLKIIQNKNGFCFGIDSVLLSDFAKDIKKDALYSELTKWTEWKKIVPLSISKKGKRISVADFRKTQWLENGIFGDFIQDDFAVYSLPDVADGRVRIPKWSKINCVDCKICLNNCPQQAILEDNKNYSSNDDKCIGCGICAAVCPKKCWEMFSNRKEIS